MWYLSWSGGSCARLVIVSHYPKEVRDHRDGSMGKAEISYTRTHTHTHAHTHTQETVSVIWFVRSSNSIKRT